MKKNIQKFLIILLTNILAVSFMNLFYVKWFYFEGILIHLLLYMALISTMICLTKKVNLSYIVLNALEWIFGTISILKIETRGQEFVPWDLSLFGNVFDLATFAQVSPEIILSVLGQLFLTIALTVIQIYVFKEFCEIPHKKGKIFIIMLTLLVFLIFPMKYKMIRMKYIVPERKGFENYSRYKGINYYGAFFNFILDLGVNEIQDMEEYSNEKIKELNAKYQTIDLGGTEEYDNVILVLMESFVDFEEILKEDFDDDIIPNYHKYTKKYINDKMNVEVIGGGTANVEYQVLTMQSMDNYPEGVFPYMHYIEDEIDALPRVFKKNGYTTTAIHTYKKGFYNRDNVFELMGFDKYIAEEDFKNPQYHNDYIDDVEIYNEIVKLIEAEEKSFIHAITMSAHSPYYTYSQYEGEDILGEEYGRYNVAINNYLYNMQKTDEMLGKLIEYIEGSKEKTLLILYGDHFPLLNVCLDDLGLIEENEKCIEIEKYPELYQTPYMVVTNSDQKIKTRGLIEPNEIGMYILENVKLKEIPWIYKVFYNYFEKIETKENYEIIQYDELHGEKYWKGI